MQPSRPWNHPQRAWLHALVAGFGFCAVAWQAPCAAASPPPLQSEIAPQRLADALAELARQTSLQLIYVSSLAAGRTSHDVPAGLQAGVALDRMLTGSGLRYEFLNDHTVRLLAADDAAGVAATAAARTVPALWTRDRLEEIVVTATRRETVLGSVPLSASVMSLEAMDAAGVRGINEIAALTPGVEYDFSTQWGPGILTNLAIRGISADKGAATTGIYIDDVPIQVPHTTFSSFYPVTFDLARVEVLRGPQGTLFGASAEGGAIRFITSEPSLERFSGQYHAELASTASGGLGYEAGAAAGGPLREGRVGFRASGWYRRDAGFVDRVDPFTGATVDADSNHAATRAGRLSLTFAINEQWRITPSVSYQSTELHDSPAFYTYLSRPGDGLLRNGKLLQQPSSDRFAVGSLRVEGRIGAMRFTSITAFVDRKAAAIVDTTNVAGLAFFGGFGNPLGPAYPTSYADAIPTQLGLHQGTLSQELRVGSTDAAARLRWVAGAYYSRAHVDDSRDTYAILAPDTPGILTSEFKIDSELSAYAQGDLAITPRLRAGAGLRFGRLRREATAYQDGFANAGAPPYLHNVGHETLPLTPRFDLAFQADEHRYYYAAIARGFRVGGGGGNGSAPGLCGGVPVPSTFKPDSVWSYELGAKRELYAHRLQLAASAFHIRWSDLQETIVDACGNSYRTNAGEATSNGFDLALDARLGEHTDLGLTVGFVDVHYTATLSNAGGGIVVERGTVVGGVPSVPAPWNGTASAQYHWTMAGDLTGYLRALEVVHSHDTGPYTEHNPQAVNYYPELRADPATSVLNLQLGVVHRGLDVRLAVNNALNARPELQRSADGPGSTLQYAYTLRPRTVALSATLRFGL